MAPMRIIRACQQCASQKLRIPGLGDGVIPETDNLSAWVCDDCGACMPPLYFDERESYNAFRQHMAVQR